MNLKVCSYKYVRICDELGVNARFNLLFQEVCALKSNSNYHLPISSPDILGGIKLGSGFSITTDGTLSVVFPPNTVLDVTTTGNGPASFNSGILNIPIEISNVPTITSLTSFTGGTKYLFVDSPQGGLFTSTTNTLTVDNGIIFPKTGGGYWVRQQNKSGGVNPIWFASLPACISSLSGPSTVVISDSYTLTSNLVIPSNVSLKINKGGSINVSIYTLTINGSFQAGRYAVFSGIGNVVFGSGAVDNQYPEWDGAYNDGTHATETTAAFTKQVKRGQPIELGIGTYLVTNISSYLNQPLIIKGQTQRQQSVIQTTADSNVGITIAGVYPVYQSILKDFSLIGTSANTGGIQLGDATNQSVVVYATIDNLQIINFTATGAYGISLNSIQEVDIHNCYIKNNYNGIYRPDLGYVTSTKISGKDSYCGFNLNRGLAIEGKLFDLHVKDVVFEGNFKEGIYYNYGNDASIILINDCYLEANCRGGIGSGLASITIIGGTTSTTRATPLIQRCQFHGNWQDIIRQTLYLDNVIGGEVSNCIGVGVEMTTTATVKCHFRDNSGTSSYFVNWKNFYSNLIGDITAEDTDIDGKRFIIGNRRFATPLTDKIYYNPSVSLTGDTQALCTVGYVDNTFGSKVNGAGTGTIDFFPKWNNSSTLVNSHALFEKTATGYIGINTTNPQTQLHVYGTFRLDIGSFLSYDSNGYGGGSLYSSYGYANGDTFIRPGNATVSTVFSPNGGVTIGGQTFDSPINGLVVKGNVGIGTTIAPTNKLEVIGNTVLTGDVTANKYITNVSTFWSSGVGSPEGVLTAPIGSMYTRTDGGTNTTLYIKENGAGNTGWIAK